MLGAARSTLYFDHFYILGICQVPFIKKYASPAASKKDKYMITNIFILKTLGLIEGFVIFREENSGL